MEDVRIILSGLWVALMLTYLLGDVLRIFAGDFKPGEIDGVEVTQWMWFLVAVTMWRPLGVLFGEVVLDDARWGGPPERSVGSVVIVEVDEPDVCPGTLGL